MRHFKDRSHPWSAVIILIVLLGGVIGLSKLSSLPLSQKEISSPEFTASSTSTEPLLLLRQAFGWTIISQNGGRVRTASLDLPAPFSSTSVEAEGVSVSNGSRVILATSGTRAEIAVRADGQMEASLDTPRSDGASVLHFRGVSNFSLAVPLRDRGSRPFREAMLLGWLSDSSFVVMVRATSTRSLVAVSLTGEVREMASLPETVMWTDVRQGAVWYAIAIPGEGLESDPHPPSELHRVTMDGKDERLLTDTDHVIASVVPARDGEELVYRTTDGQAWFLLKPESPPHLLGKVQPLLFLTSEQLMIRRGFELLLIDPIHDVSTSLGDVPEGETSLFIPRSMPSK